MLDKSTPMFAAAIRMGGEVARAVFAGVIQFLRVFKQKCCAQIGTFGAIQPTDGFIAGFMRQRFAVFVRFVAQIRQVLRYRIVTRHVFQLGNGFVQLGVFIDMINRFVEHGLQFQKFDVVLFVGKRLDRHNQVVHAIVNSCSLLFQPFGKSQLLCFAHVNILHTVSDDLPAAFI